MKKGSHAERTYPTIRRKKGTGVRLRVETGRERHGRQKLALPHHSLSHLGKEKLCSGLKKKRRLERFPVRRGGDISKEGERRVGEPVGARGQEEDPHTLEELEGDKDS